MSLKKLLYSTLPSTSDKARALFSLALKTSKRIIRRLIEKENIISELKAIFAPKVLKDKNQMAQDHDQDQDLPELFY